MAEQQEGVVVIAEARGGNVQIGGNQRKGPKMLELRLCRSSGFPGGCGVGRERAAWWKGWHVLGAGGEESTPWGAGTPR